MTDLVTLSDYKTYKSISSITFDTQLNEIIPAVSTYVKNYCGKTFIDYAFTDLIEIFSNGGNNLFLTETPIIDITSVEVSYDYGVSYTTLTANVDYYIDVNNDSLYNPNGFPKILNAIRVNYTGGYISLPLDLKIATLDLIDYYINEDYKPKKTEGRSSMENSSNRQITVSALPVHIQRVLEAYRGC